MRMPMRMCFCAPIHEGQSFFLLSSRCICGGGGRERVDESRSLAGKWLVGTGFDESRASAGGGPQTSHRNSMSKGV
eukprot:gene1187-703_t